MDKKLTFNEIKDILIKHYDGLEYQDGAEGILKLSWGYPEDYPEELGKIEVPFQYGGEGKGERWEKIYHFVYHNVYIKVEGFYTSYDGVSFYDGWDNLTEVTPVQKTITIYQ